MRRVSYNHKETIVSNEPSKAGEIMGTIIGYIVFGAFALGLGIVTLAAAVWIAAKIIGWPL